MRGERRESESLGESVRKSYEEMDDKAEEEEGESKRREKD